MAGAAVVAVVVLRLFVPKLVLQLLLKLFEELEGPLQPALKCNHSFLIRGTHVIDGAEVRLEGLVPTSEDVLTFPASMTWVKGCRFSTCRNV